jgi:hypothetical protein
MAVGDHHMAGTRQVARSTAVAALVAHHTGRQYLISTPRPHGFQPKPDASQYKTLRYKKIPTLVETHPCYPIARDVASSRIPRYRLDPTTTWDGFHRTNHWVYLLDKVRIPIVKKLIVNDH